MQQLNYLNGFANYFSTEALAGALPIGQNSPQKPPFGLVAELLSGAAFTAPRHENLRTWFYRIRPSVVHGPSQRQDSGALESAPLAPVASPAMQLRWNPLPFPQRAHHFVEGLVTMVANGDVAMRTGSAVHLYTCNRSMVDEYFLNADGDLLILPQHGRLQLRTECGILDLEPCMLAVIPRGMKFQVQLLDSAARGYAVEVYGNHLVLPHLGPIGSSGLANARDFETPVAWFEEREGDFTLLTKFAGQLFTAPLQHSPLDAVAWHGNYVPYRYDLRRFNTINTVSYDHPDPSIFTVLSSPSEHPGTANMDFVIFPERWMVAIDTFRPPYYHRNIMSEYMGLIKGVYDAKTSGGFEPGGGSLHNCMLPHGPEASVFDQATDAHLEPHYQANTLAFMCESAFLYRPTQFALAGGLLQDDYAACWKGFKPRFRQ